MSQSGHDSLTRWRHVLWSLLPLGSLACASGGEPSSPMPQVIIRTTLDREWFKDEPFPPVEVSVRPATVRIQIAEWFTQMGFILQPATVTFAPAAGSGAAGHLFLHIESRKTLGILSLWRKDHEITVEGLPAGEYRLRLVRYDPGIHPSIHRYGNPRTHVDSTVVVP